MSLIVLIGINNARSAEQWPLKKLIEYGLENSPLIIKEKLKVDEANEKIKEVRSNKLPNIEGSLDGQIMTMDLNIDLPADLTDGLDEETMGYLTAIQDINKLYSMTGGITVSQVIYNPQLKVGLKSAKTARALYELAKTLKEEEVIYEIAENYYQVLLNSSQLDVIEANMQKLEQLQRSTKLLVENDMGRKIDLSRIKVNITNLKTQRTKLKNGINIQLNYIKVLVGLPIDSELELDEEEQQKVAQLETIEGAKFDVANRAEYKSLLKQQELHQLQIENEKKGYLPSVVAFGSGSWRSYNTKMKFPDWSGTYVAGVKVSIPIWDSGLKKHKANQARSKFAQAQQDIDYNSNMLTVEYLNSINQLTTSWQALEVQKENKQLAQEVYSQSELQYKEGMASLTDLLNAEVSLREAFNAYNQHVLDYKIALLDLNRSKGTLKEMAK